MNFKLPSIIAFIICQFYPIWSQRQGANPTQALLPGGWVRPTYAAAADAWREYFIRAQQATNQLYQQWANMSGNPLSNAMGGPGGLYGLYGNIARPEQSNQPSRPLQGIFSTVAPPQSGLQLSELLPANVRPSKQDGNGQAPMQDQVQGARPQTVVHQQEIPVKPTTQARPQTQNQVTPSQIVQPPVEKAPLVQPQATQAHALQLQAQHQFSLPFQIPGVPFQMAGQVPGPIQPSVGLFSPSYPLGWMG